MVREGRDLGVAGRSAGTRALWGRAGWGRWFCAPSSGSPGIAKPAEAPAEAPNNAALSALPPAAWLHSGKGEAAPGSWPPCSLSPGACRIVPGSSSPRSPVVMSDLRVGVPAAWQQALRGSEMLPVRAGLGPLSREVLRGGVAGPPCGGGSSGIGGASPHPNNSRRAGAGRGPRAAPGKAFRETLCRTFRVCVLVSKSQRSAPQTAGVGGGGCSCAWPGAERPYAAGEAATGVPSGGVPR